MKHSLVRIVLAVSVLALLSTAVSAAALTSHKKMMERLSLLSQRDAEAGRGRVKVVSIGSSAKGRAIPLVTIADPAVPEAGKKRLFIICRQHGDEPATTEAMLGLMERLATSGDQDVMGVLSRVSFYFIPMVNPDGADAFRRRNANGADLNRDWLKLSQPETMCVWAAVDAVAPDVLIDMHELSPGNRTGDFIESAGALCGASGDVVQETTTLQNLVVGMLRTHDMTVRSVRINDHAPARLAHRYFPIREGRKTLLFETRQAGARKYQLSYRMELHVIGALTVAKYLAGQQDELEARIADYYARKYQVASRGRKPVQKKQVVPVKALPPVPVNAEPAASKSLDGIEIKIEQ
jgi:hypothetical protein